MRCSPNTYFFKGSPHPTHIRNTHERSTNVSFTLFDVWRTLNVQRITHVWELFKSECLLLTINYCVLILTRLPFNPNAA